MNLPVPFASQPRAIKAASTTPPVRRALPIAALMLGTLTVSSAMAQGQRPPDRRGPPPEAYQACEGKTEGTTVTLTMPDGKTLQGICRTRNGSDGSGHSAGTLVAMPAERPPSGDLPPLR